ncbi:MAG: agmatinase [Nitrosopumilus sp.]
MSAIDAYVSDEPLISNSAARQDVFAKILGVPFDFTSSFRPGSRFGPNSLRTAFMNIEIYSHTLNIDLEKLSYLDLGNLQTADVMLMVKRVEEVVKEIVPAHKMAIMGGEHSITYGAFRAMPEETSLLIFDAHFDLRDELLDLKFSHATYLRRLLEVRKPKNVMVVGVRAGIQEEWEQAAKEGIQTITMDDIMNKSDGSRLEDFVGKSEKLYVSIDLDVLDPATAPGVGNPEPNGLSSKLLLAYMYTMREADILGFDIVELCPPYDNGSTATLAAKLMAEMLCIAQ